jgi:RNA polymerase sigma factor (sigma-70 family)
VADVRNNFAHSSVIGGVMPKLSDDAPQPAGAEDIAELFRARREPMARLAYVLTGNSQVSDEIVQDAFLKMHTNWERITNPAGYLRTAIINSCRSYHRHLAVERRAPIARQEVAVSVTDEISDALAKLSYDHRAVLALRYFCDLNDFEIADMLRTRPGTVRSRIHRGLAQLRKEIPQ